MADFSDLQIVERYDPDIAVLLLREPRYYLFYQIYLTWVPIVLLPRVWLHLLSFLDLTVYQRNWVTVKKGNLTFSILRGNTIGEERIVKI